MFPTVPPSYEMRDVGWRERAHAQPQFAGAEATDATRRFVHHVRYLVEGETKTERLIHLVMSDEERDGGIEPVALLPRIYTAPPVQLIELALW